MKFMKLATVLLAVIVSSCGSDGNDVRNVSIVKLIAFPEEHHGKFIRLVGYAKFDPDSSVIFLSDDDFKYGNLSNGFSIEIRESERVELNGVRAWVLVEGVFNVENKGHLGLYDGSIESISRLDILEDSKD